MRLAGVALIIDTKKRVLLLKRSEYTKAFPHHWTFPGGRQDEGETAEQTVVREVQEECGLNFIPTKLYLTYKTVNSGEDIHSHRFLGTYSGKINIQEEEADGYAWYTYKETKNLELAFNYKEVIKRLHSDNLL